MLNHYDFPSIQHIDHVLPFIDDECFRVIEKDSGHTFINYVKMGSDTFPEFTGDDANDHRAAVRRECRGIAFHTRTGMITSRPFHKFFNVGERPETDVDALDFNEDHWVCDKVDGSMVRPLWTSDGIRWGTKMGLTDTAAIAELWLEDKPLYRQLAEYCIEHGKTPIFEFVSKENRVVVDYGKTDMILLALRNIDRGTYATPSGVEAFARRFGVPSTKMYESISGEAANYFASVHESEDLDEGIVVQWGSGHRVKVKTDLYSVLHRVKESARTERTLVTAILEKEVDDLLPLLPIEDRKRITRYIDRFWGCVKRLNVDIDALYNQAREDFDTKKDFAIGTKDSMTTLERNQVFSAWDGKYSSSAESVEQLIRNGLSSETKWSEMKQNIAMSTNLNSFDAGWQQ